MREDKTMAEAWSDLADALDELLRDIDKSVGLSRMLEAFARKDYRTGFRWVLCFAGFIALVEFGVFAAQMLFNIPDRR